MTDEEIAEQYEKDNCIMWKYDSLSVDEEMAEEYVKNNFERWECDCLPVDDIVKQAFLAGLKAGRPQWHEANEIQCYEDVPNDKNKLYVWVVNIAKFEKDKPILETRVGGCDELEYDIMAYHLIKWCEIDKE